MKHILANLDKAFESRVRLGIMSALMVNDALDFNHLKELLDVSDGNLASHTSALEKSGYLTVQKQFIGKKPNTSFSATEAGKKAFTAHLDALEALIRNKE